LHRRLIRPAFNPFGDVLFTLTAQQLKIASATLFRKLKDYADGRWALVLLADVARRCLEFAGAA